MAAGSIIVDLLMRTGAFTTDTDRAAKKLKEFEKQAEKVGKVVGVAIAGGALAAAAAFDQLVKSAADFKDFEETVGSSAEDIASLAVAAATAGVTMSSVTDATIKLTKGLTGVDDESKAVGAALKALGLNIEEFKQLDPVGQYEAVGKALSGFADGAQKTAVAVALFGKTGAEQLKVFKALEEQGGRQLTLTQAQIDLADRYADAQAKSAAELKVFGQVIAIEILPAVIDLTEAIKDGIAEMFGLEKAGRSLVAGSGIREFAYDAAIAFGTVAESVVGLVKLLNAVRGSFQSVYADAQVLNKLTIGGAASSFASGGVDGYVKGLAEALENRNKVAEEANKRYVDLWNYNGTAITDALRKNRAAMDAALANPASYSNEGRAYAKNLPTLQFDGAAKADKTKDKLTEADRYLERLREQVQKTEELSEIEKLLADIQAGKFKGAKEGQIAEAVRLADQLDGWKRMVELEKLSAKEAERLASVQKQLDDEGARLFYDTRTGAEQYAIQLERLNVLLQAGAIYSDTYERAVLQLQERFDESVRKQKDLAFSINQSLEGSFSNAFEGLITGSMSAKDAFKSFANSVIQDLARIASQQLARDIFGGGSSGTGGIGGLLAQLFSGTSTGAGTGFGTGSNFGNQDYGAFLATGTNYVPHDGFRATLHKGEAVVPAKYNPAAGANQGTKVQVINPPGMPMTAQAREETGQDGVRTLKLFLKAVANDIATGGEIAKAGENRYGQRPTLSRRGR